MAKPAEYLPRKGDTVTLTGVVKYDVDPSEIDVHVRVSDSYGGKDAICKLDQVKVTLRTWREGDRIVDDYGSAATVLATVGDFVWIQHDTEPDTGPVTRSANHILPLLAEPEPALRPLESPAAGLDGDEEVQF